MNRSNEPSNTSKLKSQSAACPDCESTSAYPLLREFYSRRDFLLATGAGVAAVSAFGLPNVIARAADVAPASASAATKPAPETLVKKLYDSLKPEQSKVIAFDWDYIDKTRGLLRTRVANNWKITEPDVVSNFYSQDQQDMIRGIFEGLFNPEWVPKIDKQLKDDGGGYGKSQSIALFGKPGDGKFELVMTGRHLTVRVDGESIDHMAFGGPIFHGHAAGGANEKADHPDNVFWPQAIAANKIYEMLDGKQRKSALQARVPAEQAVGFRGADGAFPGVRISELSADQREQLEKTMKVMLAPYRNADTDEVTACLKKQGGLEKCSLAFYQDGDIGDDGVWDNWRLEGPSFVWYFRGSPHVHLWINIGDSSDVKVNA